MVSRQLWHTIFGITGTVISIILFVSPILTFWNIIKKKSMEELNPDPYIATVFNCLLWGFYGLPFVHDNILVLSISVVGFIIQLLYLAVFVYYAPSSERKRVGRLLLGIGGCCALFETLVLLWAHGTIQRSHIVGIFCAIGNIIRYASPLTIWNKVIKTKSVKYMPFTLSLVSFINALVWTCYATTKFDIYILVSNSLGSFFALIQLVLYGYYWKFGVKEDESDDDDHKVTRPRSSEIVQP